MAATLHSLHSPRHEAAHRLSQAMSPLVRDIEGLVQTVAGRLADIAPGSSSDIEVMQTACADMERQIQRTAAKLILGNVPAPEIGKLRHDLRTPLNTLKGYAALLIEDLEATPSLVEPLNHAVALVATLNGLVDELVHSPAATPILATAEDEDGLGEDSLSPFSSQRARILVVEDNPANLALLGRLLTREGYKVTEALDGETALKHLERERFDLALLDYNLPGISGNDILREIKADPALMRIRVIMISAGDEAAQIGESLSLGADDYVAKPIDAALLQARIRASLARKRQQEQEEALWLNSLQTIMDLAVDGIVILNPDGTVEAANPIALAIFGKSMVGRPFGPFLAQGAGWTPEGWKPGGMLASADSRMTEIAGFREMGDEFPLEIAIKPLRHGALTRHVATCRDATLRKAEEARLAFLAKYDPATELPNRSYLSEHLNTLLETKDAKAAIFLLAITGIRELTETITHQASLTFIKSIASHLQRRRRPDDFLAYLGNGEFAMVRSDVDSLEIAEETGEALIAELPKVAQIDGNEIVVEACVAITLVPRHADNATRALRNLDLAMVRARQDEERHLCMFVETMWQAFRAKKTLEVELARAIDKRQLELRYQPKINLATGRCVGAEALIRWKHETMGWVSPGEFIPVAESTGLILPLGEFVIQETAASIAAWAAGGLPLIPVAVNVSAVQFRRQDLPAMLAEAAAARDIPAPLLEVEITESLLMQDREQVAKILRALQAEGHRISIDDFGTGHSSLSYLANLPLDKLKIDRSFVINITDSATDLEIARTVVALARALGLKTIAEGIETQAQADMLRDMGCDEVQGFFYAKPLTAEEFADFLRREGASVRETKS